MPMMLDSPPRPSTPQATTVEERRRLHHEADVVVVGAGVLGCAVAVALSNQGRSVILLEKSLKEPDRIVGELLQPGGVAALERLGLRDCLEEIDAIKVYGYDVIYYGEEVRIPYPEEAAATVLDNEKDKESRKRKRPEGRSFHHGRFIQQLRKRAMMCPNVTVVETAATDLVKSGYSGQILGVKCATGEKKREDYYFGDLTIVADGYASKFRKEFIEHKPIVKSKFYGLELIDADLPMPNHGHVVLGDGAPVLLYQIGTHETRALVDVPENTPSASVANGGAEGHLRNVVLPSLPERVRPSFEAALDRDRLRSMPNSFLPPSTNRTPGMVILGDAMNMRHPLTGGGMTVAFNDAVLLAELLSPERVPQLGDTKAVLKQMGTFHWRRKNLSSVINILAMALYSLFAANDTQLKALQLGCFRYFQMGGQCIDGPVGLLAGVIRQPFVLFYHFFAVALYAILIYLREGSVMGLPFRLIGSVGVFWKACVVIFPFIFSELRS
ncbi:Squalene epoxidase [Taxawa tesnikishii (nom. ined.)]|nr:Squalene epoxidase [Dothideales sp. JES 119]